jgi:hypothetical protein
MKIAPGIVFSLLRKQNKPHVFDFVQNIIGRKMGIGNKNLGQSKELKLQQILHCQRVKPWIKSTGPKSAEGKAKVALNLPRQKGEFGKITKGLLKLDEALHRLKKLEGRTRKRKLTAIKKLEQLVKKAKI